MISQDRIAENLACAEEILGYRFQDQDLLRTALTHSSAAPSESHVQRSSYERLEFLGDAILGMVISRMIFDRFPHLDEGGMTRIKVAVVAGHQLTMTAQQLGFADLIIFGSSERGTGNRGLASALEDTYEACVAALSLDGGLDAATAFIQRTLGPLINEDLASDPTNPKSVLQEKLQTRHITPTYEVVNTEGPPHRRTFTVQVLAEGVPIGQGCGHSKKDAEAAAASAALESLN